MSEIQYMVGRIPITIALQVMAQLGKARVSAQLTPTDQDTAAIEVALFDRAALDDLMRPFEPRPLIDMTLPFADLHAAILAGRYTLGSGSDEQSAFTALLISYQTVAHDSARLDDLADVCNRRVARNLPLDLDLLAAYGALSRLARWRAAQLRGAK